MSKLWCLRSHSIDSVHYDIEGDPRYKIAFSYNIQDGQLILIKGKFFEFGLRFTIDFCLDNPKKDIALRVAARIYESTLVRNSRIKRVWGIQETAAPSWFHLEYGMAFEFQLYFKKDNIAIAFGGKHMTTYDHRLPFDSIQSLEIRGDIMDVVAERVTTTSYPLGEITFIARIRDRQAEAAESSKTAAQRRKSRVKETTFLPVPYFGRFRSGFFGLGNIVIIKGHINDQAKMFKVAIQLGQNFFPQPNIAMQVEFRFTEKSGAEANEPDIILNSFEKEKWKDEIKVDLRTGLRPGGNFNLRITRAADAYKIMVNDRDIYDYQYLVDPQYMDTCYIEGDIKLLDILLQDD